MNWRQIAIVILLPVVAVAVVVALIVSGESDDDPPEPVTDYPYEIETFPDLGRDHFQTGLTFDRYNSNPPTSGPHASTFIQWGIYEEPVAKEIAVHNMEHAGVIVWYNCEGPDPLSAEECATLRNDLSSVVQPMIADGRSIIMTPYGGMSERIALTAWQHLDTLDEFDEERVRMFIETFECRFDPENLC